MFLRTTCLALAILLFVASASLLRADILAQSDFQGGTVDGWNQPFDSNAVTVVANSGPLGNGDFSIASIPRTDNGTQFLFPQQDSKAGFIGNYVAANATHVRFDYRGVGTLASGVELYVLLLNGNGNRWVSLNNVVPTSSWQTATISIQQPNVVRALGSNTYATDFSNITIFGFRFQQNANQAGGSAVGSNSYNLFLDNIQVQSVPEPASFLALSLLTVAGCARRVRRAF